MYMADLHLRYVFKPSRIALGFQLLSLLFIFVLLSFLLNFWFCLFLSLFALLSLKIFRLQPKVAYIEYLDQTHWSLKFQQSSEIQRVQIQHMFDHSLYIVIRFDEKKVNNLIIWQDQLSKKQWKSLKTRAKLG